MSIDGKADALIGKTIDDKYRIESKLGEGGMGAVYLSTRLMIGDTVAIKILHSTQVSDPQAIERFRREAQAAARLKHQNAVTIYDFGVSNEGLVYLVMELAEGQSLRDIIKLQGPVTPSAAAEIMSQVCAALDAAHRQHIVHRDMKPDNIIVDVTNTGLRVKVLDFGIAKMRDLTASNLTQTGAVMGTPYYMSPEHCLGEELDHRSDIYSLGIVLYEMLAGVVPFNSPISTAVVVQHVNQAPPSLRALNASISPAVEAVVMHALEKHREARPQTAVQLAQELISSVQGSPVTPHSGSMPVSPFYSTPASTTPAANPVTGAALAPTIQMTAPPQISGAQTAAAAKKRLPLKLGVSVVIIVTVAIIGLLIWARQSGQDANAPSLTVDLGNNVKLKLVLIKAGSFTMGSTDREVDEASKASNLSHSWFIAEQPAHQVNITKPFYLGKYEVTQAQWQAVIGSNPSDFKDCGGNCPVEHVSWNDAQDFIKRLNAKQTQYTYRLPTEAEWEYAARAGTTTAFAFGDSLSSEQASFYPDGNAPSLDKTVAVGSYQPNAWGLYDMHGNVSEWCQDLYDENYYKNSPAGDPQGPNSGQYPPQYAQGDLKGQSRGQYHVQRGGAWLNPYHFCRSACRGWSARGVNEMAVGFRVVVLARAQPVKAPKEVVAPVPPAGMAYVPGNEFTMGNDAGDDSERPQHKVTVKPFFIDIYEVTCEEYEKFIRATSRQPPATWANGHYPSGWERRPVTGVNWDDASAYAEWAGKRLPTEQEWEFAARGSDGRLYPWGSEWKDGSANAGPTSPGHVVDVGTHSGGVSPFGAVDMVGNAWEWTASDFVAYPGGSLSGQIPVNPKVIRGGTFLSRPDQATTTIRVGWPARGGDEYDNTGFRCAKDLPATSQ